MHIAIAVMMVLLFSISVGFAQIYINADLTPSLPMPTMTVDNSNLQPQTIGGLRLPMPTGWTPISDPTPHRLQESVYLRDDVERRRLRVGYIEFHQPTTLTQATRRLRRYVNIRSDVWSTMQRTPLRDGPFFGVTAWSESVLRIDGQQLLVLLSTDAMRYWVLQIEHDFRNDTKEVAEAMSISRSLLARMCADAVDARFAAVLQVDDVEQIAGDAALPPVWLPRLAREPALRSAVEYVHVGLLEQYARLRVLQMPVIDSDHPLLDPKLLLAQEGALLLGGAASTDRLRRTEASGLKLWQLVIADGRHEAFLRSRLYVERADGRALLVDKLCEPEAEPAINRDIDFMLRAFAAGGSNVTPPESLAVLQQRGESWLSRAAEQNEQHFGVAPPAALIALGNQRAGWQLTRRMTKDDEPVTPIAGEQAAVISGPGRQGGFREWVTSAGGQVFVSRHQYQVQISDTAAEQSKPLVCKRGADQLHVRLQDDEPRDVYRGTCPQPMIPPGIVLVPGSDDDWQGEALLWQHPQACKPGLGMPVAVIQSQSRDSGSTQVRQRRLMSLQADVFDFDDTGEIIRYRTCLETRRPLGGLPMTIQAASPDEVAAAYPQAARKFHSLDQGQEP